MRPILLLRVLSTACCHDHVSHRTCSETAPVLHELIMLLAAASQLLRLGSLAVGGSVDPIVEVR